MKTKILQSTQIFPSKKLITEKKNESNIKKLRSQKQNQ